MKGVVIYQVPVCTYRSPSGNEGCIVPMQRNSSMRQLCVPIESMARVRIRLRSYGRTGHWRIAFPVSLHATCLFPVSAFPQNPDMSFLRDSSKNVAPGRLRALSRALSATNDMSMLLLQKSLERDDAYSSRVHTATSSRSMAELCRKLIICRSCGGRIHGTETLRRACEP